MLVEQVHGPKLIDVEAMQPPEPAAEAEVRTWLGYGALVT